METHGIPYVIAIKYFMLQNNMFWLILVLMVCSFAFQDIELC